MVGRDQWRSRLSQCYSELCSFLALISKSLAIDKDTKYMYTPNVNNEVSIYTILKVCFMKR